MGRGEGDARLTCVVEGMEYGRLLEVQLPEPHGAEESALGLAGLHEALERSRLGAAGLSVLRALIADVDGPQRALLLVLAFLARGRLFWLLWLCFGRHPQRLSVGIPAATLHAWLQDGTFLGPTPRLTGRIERERERNSK